MIKNMYRFLLGVFALSFLLTGSLSVKAQDAAADFDRLLPEMSATDPANAEQVKKMEAAQQEWFKICMKAGAPDQKELLAQVNKLMTEKIASDIPVDSKVWLLHMLAWTGGASEIEAIAALTNNSELRVRDEAIRALGNIAGDEAVNALKKALETADDADKARIESAIAAHSTDISVGIESEFPQALAYVDDAEAADWLKGFDDLSVDDQVRTLVSLTVRKDRKYIDYALKALKSNDENIKRAGLLAMEKLADADQVSVLLNQLYTGDRGLTRMILGRIEADGFDAALLKAVKEETNPEYKNALLEVLSDRFVSGTVSEMLTAAQAENCPNRLALLISAEKMAVEDDIPSFVDVLLLIPAGGDRDRAEQVIARLAKGNDEKVLPKLNKSTIPVLLPLLGRIGSQDALKRIDEALKSTDASAITLAVRSLSNWPNAEVAQRLLAVADNKSFPENLKIQALRAFIRIISLPDDQIGIKISPIEKLDMLKNAMKMAVRTEERGLILDRAAAIRDVATLAFAMEYIEDKEVGQNACKTVIELAHHNFLRNPNKDVFKPALEKVLTLVKDPELKTRAERYLENIN